MNKDDFIKTLTAALSGLPQSEIDNTVNYYCEIIADAVEDGESETDVIAKLGSIDEIASKIINDTPLSTIVKENIKGHKLSGGEIALLIIGSPVWLSLLLAAFGIVIAVYAALWIAVIALFASSAASALSGLALIGSSPFIISDRPLQAMLSFGIGLVSAGAAIFVFYLSLFLSKQLIRLTAFIIKKIKNSVISKGGMKNE